MERYDIEARAKQEGWGQSLVRAYVNLYRPQVTVSRAYGVRHPLHWDTPPDKLVHIDIDYPRPHDALPIPDDQVAYAVNLFRSHLELAISLERELTGDDHIHFEHTRADDDGPPLTDDEYGIRCAIVIMQQLMARLHVIDPAAARAEVTRWPIADSYVFARMRIWSAANRLLDPDEGAATLLALTDELFWSTHHQRDLLYAVRDLWPDLSVASRTEVEQRLLTTTYPWSGEVRGGPSRAEAHYRLSRLHWLVSQGVTFSFDVEAELAALREIDPEWTMQAGDHIADSNAPEVYAIETDTAPDAILETPIAQILDAAQAAGGHVDFFDHVQREPFRGLAEQRPLRALAALIHAARSGGAPPAAWSAFLYADARLNDSVRMIALIGGRLQLLPLPLLNGIAYPVSDWMQRIGHRLYGDAASVLPSLWNRLVTALALGDDGRAHRADQSWADDALNAPVGRLVRLLMDDPMKQDRVVGGGFPAHWTARADQLLALPGDRRRHALVMMGNQYNWLFNIDPAWTGRALLPAIDAENADAEAVWDGIFWAARSPSRPLFERIKAGLIARARRTSSRRKHAEILAGMLLAGWGGEADALEPKRLVTDAELREVLIHADDELRGQVLWHLGNWSRNVATRWPERLVPFLRAVWPKQRALRNPVVSARLVDIALGSGDQMPAVVEAILPRLVPARSTSMHTMLMTSGADPHPAHQHPAALLDLLWAVLGEDPQLWPYKIEATLELLSEDPSVGSDPRLSELRRRRQG